MAQPRPALLLVAGALLLALSLSTIPIHARSLDTLTETSKDADAESADAQTPQDLEQRQADVADEPKLAGVVAGNPLSEGQGEGAGQGKLGDGHVADFDLDRLVQEATRRRALGGYVRPDTQFTDRPVVGIVTLPITVPSQRKFGPSSFATSYARWIEAGGARVVPIFYDSTKEELDFLLPRINGVFMTGGLVDFNPSEDDPEGSKYLFTTQYVYDYVVAENHKGNYYPIWGTCLGFERLTQLLAKDPNATIIEEVDAENFAINLGFTAEGWLSRLFGGMSYVLFKVVASPLGDLAFNNHGLGIAPESLLNSPAGKEVHILSIDNDRLGKPFVSTIEGKRFPYYGTQWHPEKAPWEWNPEHAISHSQWALTFSNYLGRFFVDECKYNKNKFNSEAQLSQYLVSNWPSMITSPGGKKGVRSAYSEITFFPTHAPMKAPVDLEQLLLLQE